MSDNIIDIRNTSCSLRILVADARKIMAIKANLPERCTFTNPRFVVAVEQAWAGIWSGQTWDYFTEYVLPATEGDFRGIVTWEGGHGHTCLKYTMESLQRGRLNERTIHSKEL